MTLAVLFFIFVAFCIFIVKAPGELTKTLLAGVWAMMALGAVGSTIYAIGFVALH